ncbi:MAG: hypothetical protein M3P89_08870, partial [Actinomycetota bacterium]|nr:hypothetical protein [Actinomycetota bacterium]
MSTPSTERTAFEPAMSEGAAPPAAAPEAEVPGTSMSGGRLRPSRQTLAVLSVMAALLGIAVVLGRDFLLDGPLLPSPTLPWWVLALAFAATESSVLHIQRSRQARSVSISELPLVL